MASTDATRQRYVVGFTVHEAKELSRDGTAVDPLCIVRALGRQYETELKKGKQHHVKFNESYIWSDVYLTEDEFNMSFIDFELQAANIFTRNETLGTARVQLAMVRRRPNHTSAQKWLQLSNDKHLSAKLKVTVFCYGQGDEPPKPEDQEHDQEETEKHLQDLNTAVLGHGGEAGKLAQDMQAYHLFVQVHRAEHLGGGEKKYNPYVTVEFNGHRLESPPARETHTLMFDECFRVPVVLPLLADSVLIRIWDKKKWQSDNIIVQGRLSFSLLRMHAMQPKWFNFYGFSTKEVGDVAALTGQGEAAEENVYQGRLLISGRVQKVPRVEDLFKAAVIKGQVVEEPPASALTFALDVIEISGCPGSEVYVEMSIGSKGKTSKAVKRVDYDESYDYYTPGRFRYSPGEGRVSPLVAVVPTDASNQLDMILSIYSKLDDGIAIDGTFQRVGFVRVKIANIKDWRGETAPPFWVPCRPMAHLPSSVEPGSILVSLAKSTAQIKDRGVPNVKPLHFELRCYVCMARGLVSQSNEVPSPFCQVSCAGSLARTETAPHTTAPTWGDCLKVPIELQCALDTLRVQPEPIQVVVYDEVEDTIEALSKVVDTTGALNKLAGQAVQSLQDRMAGMTGDVLAKKRAGAVVNGRRVIGRAQVSFRSPTRPGFDNPLQPKWVKLKGGLVGTNHVGDILIGFEMMKKKYSKDIMVQSTKPLSKGCTLAVAVLGLRDVAAIHGRVVDKPKLQVVVPSMSGGEASTRTIEWSSKPSSSLSADDVNRRWTVNGQTGFEFMTVVNLDVLLPKHPVWEPSMRFRLLDGAEKDTFLAEGRVSLAEHIPWVKPGRGKKAVAACDDFTDPKEGADDGVPVSDAEDQGGASYCTVEVAGDEPLGVAFNKGDEKSFPPIVVSVEGKPREAGVKRGNWFVAYKMPQEEEERRAAHWSPADAAKFVAEMDKRKARPLTLRFRRAEKSEVFMRLLKGQSTGLALIEDQDVRPPKIAKDMTKERLWKRAGIGAGWRIIDINGVDTKAMASKHPAFERLLEDRRAVVTCRPHGVSLDVAEEMANQMDKPVMLNGVPSKVQREFNHMMKHKDQAMALTTVPRPSLVLPKVIDTKQLNMYTARGACMDVRGIVKHVMSGNDHEDDNRTRPDVPGRLEEHMEPPTFDDVELVNGPKQVGRVKFCYKVIHPRDKEWVQKIKDPSHPDRTIFDEPLLRKKFKEEVPVDLRVRVYVIRGLNVSGANDGYGNPYLFFKYGDDSVWLDGARQHNTVEPRFFRTEERDVHLPEQAHFEVGLYDWQENAEDQLIGKSVIDLESRWFTPTFQAYMKQNKVPIEYRPLVQDSEGSSSLCKGSLEMWLEILDATAAAEVPANPLVQPPATEVEIRAVVWTVRNMSLRLCVDEETGDERESVDIRVKCNLDCKSYMGPQPREQETDIHYGSEGDGEFNWRFIFSRVAVTQGVPLDCFLQFTIWEQFALRRPELLCENLVEMKNYCKKVAQQAELLQMDAEVPLMNKRLSQLLAKEMEGADGVDDNSDEEDEGSDDEQALLQQEGLETRPAKETPPAALMKVMVQVISQTEASTADMKVGLGRNEPNRNPILTYPRTGRTWENVLPGAAKVIENIVESFTGARRRAGCLSVILLILLIIGGLHYVKNAQTGCPYIQNSCKRQSTCGACACCHHQDVAAAQFCYYSFLGSADSVCAAQRYQDSCNIKASTCQLATADTCDEEVDCFATPRKKTAVVSTGTSTVR